MLGRRSVHAVLVFFGPSAVTATLAWWVRFDEGFARAGVAGLATYLITETGSAWCVPVLLVLALALWATDLERPAPLRRRETLFMLAIMLAGLPVTAALVESIIKPRVREPRPSHERLADRGWIADLDSFYSMAKPERRAQLRAHAEAEGIDAHAERLGLHPRVLEHWIHESGSTFPSAHALNAFLAATLLWGGALAAPTRRRRATAYVFVVWAVAVAVSRVALAVHRPLDVVAGAVAGTLLGLLFLRLWCAATRNRIASSHASK